MLIKLYFGSKRIKWDMRRAKAKVWMLIGFQMRCRLRARKFKECGVMDRHRTYIRHVCALKTKFMFKKHMQTSLEDLVMPFL
jgi:hypothetical protein